MVLIFDWGDTVMRDFPGQQSAMADWEHVEWVPAMEDALQELSSNYFCAIATNAGVSDTALMKKALSRIGADKYFSFFTSSKDLSCEKPDPLFFVKIATILGVRPDECVHIGNIYEKDICSAKSAGMHTIFFNEKGLNENFPAANHTITHMSELPDAVKKIRASTDYLLEICCDSLQSARIAAENGASRIELCAGLGEGGITPSIGTIAAVRDTVNIPVNVLIRPRPGNFNYNKDEIRLMIRDIEFCKKTGIQGVVLGALLIDGRIDEENCKLLRNSADYLDTTFHRAIDVCTTPDLALEQIINMGYKRILTSGQVMTAFAGMDQIAEWIKIAQNRIRIMPGAGINEGNVAEIARNTKAREFHMSLRSPGIEEYTLEALSVHTGYLQISGERVKKVRQILDQLS